MCGIVGWISKNNNVEPSLCRRALESIKHRGPDCQRGIYWDSDQVVIENLGDFSAPQKADIFLGHTRLSILDLDQKSHQPFSRDNRHWLVYNGEIYNYLEIRTELEDLGHVFHTDCDTEVVLISLMEYGAQAIDRFNGMWSFAFFNPESRELLLSRDRYGKKPLFYSSSKSDFVFGSEFKALYKILGEEKRRMVPEFARDFVYKGEWGTIDGTSTCYEGISAVEPGTVHRLCLETLCLDAMHTSPNNFVLSRPSPDAKEALPELVASAVKYRLRADVPVGVLISGGVDSSIVAGYLSESGVKNVTWFAGDTGHGNDIHYSRLMAEAFNHPLEIINVSPDGEIMEILKEMTFHYEVPVWLLGNSIGVYLMYRAMHGKGIKVVLDGTGGDEVFGGYYNFYAESVVDDCVARKSFLEAFKFIWDCWRYRHNVGRKLWNRLWMSFKNLAGLSGTPLADCQIRDIQSGHLPSWLYMNDQNSMAHSMEARSPLLDPRLAQYVSLSAASKFHDGYNKHALRKAMPASVPECVRWRRDKQGFRWLPDEIVKTHFDEMKHTIEKSDFVREVFRAYQLPGNFSGCSDTGFFLRLYAVALLDYVNLSRRNRDERLEAVIA